MKTHTLENMFDEVEKATGSVQAQRDDARDGVVSAIRAIEGELRERLSGGTLRGLKNIGTDDCRFYAGRVRGKTDAKILWPEEENATAETLVITADGELQMAICCTDANAEIIPDLATRDIHDGEFRAEDLRDLLRTLSKVLSRHTVYAERAVERYADLRELSEMVLEFLRK